MQEFLLKLALKLDFNQNKSLTQLRSQAHSESKVPKPAERLVTVHSNQMSASCLYKTQTTEKKGNTAL